MWWNQYHRQTIIWRNRFRRIATSMISLTFCRCRREDFFHFSLSLPIRGATNISNYFHIKRTIITLHQIKQMPSRCWLLIGKHCVGRHTLDQKVDKIWHINKEDCEGWNHTFLTLLSLFSYGWRESGVIYLRSTTTISLIMRDEISLSNQNVQNEKKRCVWKGDSNHTVIATIVMTYDIRTLRCWLHRYTIPHDNNFYDGMISAMIIGAFLSSTYTVIKLVRWGAGADSGSCFGL